MYLYIVYDKQTRFDNVHVVHIHVRQLIFFGKSDCRGCAVLLCLVICLTLLASFFLPSHLLH